MENVKISYNLVFSIFNTIILGLVNLAFPFIIGFLYNPIIVGEFTFFNSWAIILSIPIVNGIAPTLSRFIASESEEEGKIIDNMSTIFSLIYLVTILIVFPIANIFTIKFYWQEILLLIALLFLTSLHYLFRYSKQGKEEFNFLFIVETISFIVFIPLALVFLLQNNVHGFISNNRYYFLLIPMIAYHFVFDLIFLVKKRNIFSNFSLFNKTKAKRILIFALFVFLSNIFVLGLSQVQIIISREMLTSFEVGVLGFWNNAIAPLALLTVSITILLIPRLTNLQLNNNHQSTFYVKKFNWSLSLITVPIFGTLFIVLSANPNWINYLVPDEYLSTTYWPVIILLAIRELNNLLWSPTMAYLSTSEKYIRYTVILSFVYAASVTISWIFIVPLYGILGLAAGIAIGSDIMNFSYQLIGFIIYRERMGLHTIYLIAISGFWYLLYSFLNWSIIGIILIWIFLNLPCLIYGIYALVKLLKTKDLSIRIQPSNDLNLDNKIR